MGVWRAAKLLSKPPPSLFSNAKGNCEAELSNYHYSMIAVSTWNVVVSRWNT
jgi:hypothetical protein